MKKVLLVLLLSLFINSAYANNVDDEVVSVYSNICEKIKSEENVSQTRMRASDKAIAGAVGKLEILELPRKEFDEYDFNILVYKLVDNHIENLNIRTIKQDYQNVCIEVDGQIKGSNIISAVIETKEIADKRAQRRAEENLSGKSALHTQKQIENIIKKEAGLTDTSTNENKVVKYPDELNEKTSIIEPKSFDEPEKDIFPYNAHKVIINDDGDTTIVLDEEIKELDNNYETLPEVSDEEISFGTDIQTNNKKTPLYVLPTKYFDNTSSEKQSDIIKNVFSNNEYVIVTDNKDEAKYIVSPSILRIKIDAINNITNRMQMVVMIEMEDIDEQTNIKEHQNRFILLSIEDNEQKIAQDLMEKLLEKAGRQILNKVELTERKKKNIKGLPKIITPANLAN